MLNRVAMLVVLLLTVSPALGSAQSTCVADHRAVQTERPAGHLLQARDAASRCANAACPQLVREDCMAWYVELESSVPSVVFEVRDDSGHDLAQVQVKANGRALPDAANGRAIAIDPGRYLLRLEAQGYRPLERELVVREGGKHRVVAVTLQPLRSVQAARAVPARRFSPTVITLGAVAGAGLVTFAGLGIAGWREHDQLESSHCKPDCSRSEVEHANRIYIAADIAAGVAVAAALAGTIVYFSGRKQARERAALRWDASAFAGGGRVSLLGSF